MSIEELTLAYPWSGYSNKLKDRISNPMSAGIITPEEANSRKMRLVIGQEGSLQEENLVKFFLMVDPEEGTIVESKFQAFGQSALIGMAEAICEFLIGKNYDQACHLNVNILEHFLRDKNEESSFPFIFEGYAGLVIDAVIKAANECKDIPLADTYVSPMPEVQPGNSKGYPGWKELPLAKKLAVIEKVLDDDLRPYIAMDGGGIELLKLIEDKEVVIAYQGTCTTCMSSVGATLSYIQQVLQMKVDPDLRVVPDFGEEGGPSPF
jgi:NifU-like protein